MRKTHIAKDPDYDPETVGTDGAHPVVYDGRAFAGLTKREYFAAQAMQGILAADHVANYPTPEDIAEFAVANADALINALNTEEDK